MGGIVATSVFVFDVSIQYVHDLPDIFAQVSVAMVAQEGMSIKQQFPLTGTMCG